MDFKQPDPEKLKAEQEEQSKKKNLNLFLGNLADSFSGQSSVGHYVLGQTPKSNNNSSELAKAQNANVADPYERDQKQADVLKRYREAKLAAKADAETAAYESADSAETKALYEAFAQGGLALKPGMTGKQVLDAYGKPAEYLKGKWEKDLAHKNKLEEMREEARLKPKKETDELTGLIKMERLEKLKREADEERLSREVPGYAPTGEVMPTKQEAQKLRDSVTIANSMKQDIARMKELVKAYGTEFNDTNARREMAEINTRLRMKQKNIDELGVLNGPDLGLMIKQIPDPTDNWENLKAVIPGFGNTGKNIYDSFERLDQTIAREVNDKTAARGYRPKDAKGSRKIVKTQTNQKTGQKRIIYDDGTAEIVEPVAGR